MAEDEQYEYHLDHGLYIESSDYGGTQQESHAHNLVRSEGEVASYDPYNPAMHSFQSENEL